MSGFLCSMVGASFTVAAAAEVLRSKKGITAFGNAQVSTAQSKFGGSSALFDGNTDALYITDYSGFTFTGDFTIEMFVRMTQYGEQTFLDMREGSGGTNTGAFLYRDSSSNLKFELGGSAILTDADPNILTNQWDHIAVSRSGTSIKLFVNGTETASATSSASGTPKNFYIGRNSFSATSGNTVGYIDEIRISNSARYTSAFVVPTQPFVNDANTLLLIHANGTNASTFFEDDNGATTTRTAKTIEVNGNAQLSTAQEKFGQSSIVFDGTGDYLQLDTFGAVAQSNQDFTIEFWVRWSSLTGGQGLVSDRPPTSSGYGATNFYFEKNSSNTLFFGYSGGGDITGTSSVAANTWYHMAVVRLSGTTKFYLNGTTSGNTLSYTGVVGDGTLSIGAVVGQYMNGYIDELRISNVARYSANFTAPAATFENDANTLLLIHAEGADASVTITDDVSGRSQRGISAIGNAQVDTAQSKFGGSALLCDGTGDYLLSPAGTQWDFGTSSFTIEYWIRFNAINTLYVPIALRTSASILNGEWWCEITAAENKMYWGFKNYAGTQYYVNLALAGTAFATGQFYHIALVNNAGTAQMYVNGTATGATTALSGSFGISTTDLWVGAGAGAYSVNGWMDEVRISNTARYTSGFTPSTTAFVNDANTLLLLHMNQADAATIFQDDNTGTVTTEDSYTVPAAAFTSDALTVALWHLDNALTDSSSNAFTFNTSGGFSSVEKQFGTHSGDLSDSTSDFFAHTTDRQFAPYNGSIMTDLTWECWVYYTSFSGASFNHASQNNPHPTLLCAGDQAGNRQSLKFGFSGSEGPYSSGLLCFAAGDLLNGNIDTHTARGTTTYSLNTWYHIALTYNSLTGNVKGYVNGVKEFTKQAPNLGYSLPTHFTIGAMQSNNSACYVDEVRISRMIRYGI
jgi:hypothetical protein